MIIIGKLEISMTNIQEHKEQPSLKIQYEWRPGHSKVYLSAAILINLHMN
jgi:hypothetical protein